MTRCPRERACARRGMMFREVKAPMLRLKLPVLLLSPSSSQAPYGPNGIPPRAAMAAAGAGTERTAGAGAGAGESGEINVVAGGGPMEMILVSAWGPPRSVAITR